MCVLAVMTLAACGVAPPDRHEVDTAFASRAKAVAQAWQDSRTAADWSHDLIVLDKTLHVPDDWPEPQYSDGPAFFSGSFRLDAALSAQPPSGKVSLPGEDLTVDVWSAETAYDILTKDSTSAVDCLEPGSDPTGSGDDGANCGSALTITAVAPSSREWFTNRGMVALPTWDYTVAGYDEPVSQVAFETAQIPALPSVTAPQVDIPDAALAAAGLDSSDATTLSFDVSSNCATDVRPLLYETDTLIVLAGSGTPTSDENCHLGTDLEEVSVELAGGIGSRVIIDAIFGTVLRFGRIYPA